jgi:DNA-binding Lrp family transcriptional regulator
MDFLTRNFDERNSINEIGRKLEISPRGIYKILKNLEEMNAIKPEKIGNAIYYKVNLDEEIGVKLAAFVLVQNELNKYAKLQAEDLKQLKDITLSCILYGSVIRKGREAKDIDVMIVLSDENYKEDYKKVYEKLREISKLKPKKIHDLTLTRKDLVKGIKNKDDVIMDVIKTGKILWGSEIIVEAIKNGAA